MKWHRVRAIARKEFIHVFRDPRALGIGIVIPMLMLFLFGYALTLDVDNVPFLVWDQAGTALSRDLVSRFAGSRYFSLREYVDGYPEIEKSIDRREAILALVIPRDYDRDIAAGRAELQLIVDGSNANTAMLASSYAEAIVRGVSQRAKIEEVARQGRRPPSPALEIRPRVWFNPDMESRNAIVPGLIAVIMMVIAALLTSLTVAREWETGTMEQLISTPVTSGELIAGKLAPYFVIGFVDIVTSILMGRYAFDVPLRGDVILLLVISCIYILCALGLGILVSIVSRSQLIANQLAMVLTFLPAFLLSGFMFPIANMPDALQAITHIVPARYFIILSRGIFMKGVGIDVLWHEGLFLLIFAVTVLLLARAKFRKKMD